MFRQSSLRVQCPGGVLCLFLVRLFCIFLDHCFRFLSKVRQASFFTDYLAAGCFGLMSELQQIWVGAWWNLQNNMCPRQRLSPACASPQPDQSLLGDLSWHFFMRTAKTDPTARRLRLIWVCWVDMWFCKFWCFSSGLSFPVAIYLSYLWAGP